MRSRNSAARAALPNANASANGSPVSSAARSPSSAAVGRGLVVAFVERRARPAPAAISTMPCRLPQRRSSGIASSANARASRRSACAPALPHDGDRHVIRIAELLGERALLARERLRPVVVAEVGGVGGDHVERHAAPLEVAGGGAQRERGVGVLDALLHADPAQEDRAREARPAARSLARARLRAASAASIISAPSR